MVGVAKQNCMSRTSIFLTYCLVYTCAVKSLLAKLEDRDLSIFSCGRVYKLEIARIMSSLIWRIFVSKFIRCKFKSLFSNGSSDFKLLSTSVNYKRKSYCNSSVHFQSQSQRLGYEDHRIYLFIILFFCAAQIVMLELWLK
jgi:hypothetical protein